MTTIHRIAGEDSIYNTQAGISVRNQYSPEAMRSLLGILQALHEDVENDFLETINERIHGEVFTDFLDMGEYLLKEGYKDAAAVMIGGVLESHLRQLCVKHQILIENPDGTARVDQLLLGIRTFISSYPA